MSQVGAVSRLALRELWMSFRLIVLLAAAVVAGAVVALLPGPLPLVVERLAIGLGAAAVVAGAVAAWSLASERRRGRTGWLIARAVPRATYLSGWFITLGAVTLVGHLIASALGWLAATTVALQLDAAIFATVLAATLAGSLASLAFGTLVGVLLPAAMAALLVVAAGVGLGVAAASGQVAAEWLPGAGSFAVLAAYREGNASLGQALVAGGVALATAGLLLGAARIALERADL